jgi:ABC-type cobalt transport system substrate-binding protein
MRSSPEEIAALRKAVIDLVKRDRKNVDAEGRAKTDEAIKNYYEPFLERIFTPPKGDAATLSLASVAHAG